MPMLMSGLSEAGISTLAASPTPQTLDANQIEKSKFAEWFLWGYDEHRMKRRKDKARNL
jgi:hypothetical protein